MDLLIRRAEENEAWFLTRLTFKSKAHWQYPPEYFLIWKQELTITAQYIRDNLVFILMEGQFIRGYYSLVFLSGDKRLGNLFMPRGWWLEHLFIFPEFLGRGWGRQLLYHALDQVQAQGGHRVQLFSDPHAQEFYEKLGARFLGFSPSSIPGRQVPWLDFTLEPALSTLRGSV